MDTPNEIRDFLTTRRAALTPTEAGLPDYGGRRRVPGLRREEVALLAGMSVEYYTRFERGNASGVSELVLEGIVRALQLDDAERNHLYGLVRAANDGARPVRRRPVTRTQNVRATTQRLLDAMTSVPALIQNGRLDVIATNPLARTLFSEMYVQPQRPVNFARFLFLEPRAQVFYRDWEDSADQLVSLLRAETGRNRDDRALSDLVGELSTRSDYFRRLWGAHAVREHRTGTKHLHHPAVGDLDLSYEALELSNDRGLQLIAWTAEPSTSSHEALQLLGNISISTTIPVSPTGL